MLGEHFLTHEDLEQFSQGLPGELRIRRQTAVDGMGDLVGIVADATKLREQGRVDWAMACVCRDFNTALSDQPLA